MVQRIDDKTKLEQETLSPKQTEDVSALVPPNARYTEGSQLVADLRVNPDLTTLTRLADQLGLKMKFEYSEGRWCLSLQMEDKFRDPLKLERDPNGRLSPVRYYQDEIMLGRVSQWQPEMITSYNKPKEFGQESQEAALQAMIERLRGKVIVRGAEGNPRDGVFIPNDFPDSWPEGSLRDKPVSLP